jgi:predicted HAD superfamily Cof-like phosphohydrolase
MTTDWQADVEEFCRKHGQLVLDKPAFAEGKGYRKLSAFRKRLIREEQKELFQAMTRRDLAGIADGIVDSIVVLLGTAAAYGIYIQPVWDLVHESNMKKDGGGCRADGKVQKPLGWQPPDIQGEIRRQQEE